MQTLPADWPSMSRVRSSRHSKKVSCETLSPRIIDWHSNPQWESQSFYYSDDEKDNRIEGSAKAGEEDGELENPGYGYGYGKVDNSGHGYLNQDRELRNPRAGYGYLVNPNCGYSEQGRELVIKPSHGHGNLENPGDGDGKAFSDAGRRFFARLLPKMSYGKSEIGDARPVKEMSYSKSDIGDARRAQARKRLQKHHSAVSHTGGLLTQSGHIILHIGSHSAPLNNINGKVPASSLKSLSLIPRNAVAAGKMNPSSPGEPFSPKVTCLGGVRIKQKCPTQASKSSSVLAIDNKKEQQLDFRCTDMLKRREKKKEDTEATRSAYVQHKRTGRIGFGNTKETDCGIEGSEERRVPGKASINAMERLTAQDSRENATMASRCLAKEESKGSSSRDTIKHEESKSSYQHEQKWQSSEASAHGTSSPDTHSCINLSRFGSAETQKNSRATLVCEKSQKFEPEGDKEITAQAPPPNALLLMKKSRPKDNSEVPSFSHTFKQKYAGAEKILRPKDNSQVSSFSQRFKQDGDEKFIAQVPPPNALLLMRNTRAKDNSEVSSSARWSGPETTLSKASASDHVRSKTMSTQLQHKCDKSEPSACLEMEMEIKEPIQRTDTPSSTNATDIQRRASFPQPASELSLWQRRAIVKLCAVDVGKPIKFESKRTPTTTEVN